ncbi:MAG: hypothetical protein WD844_13290 [Thermoleophilaceae bacterium]
MHTLEAEMSPPDLWQHHRSGALSCAYSKGEQTFTWEADAVADMARTWRQSGVDGPGEQAKMLLEAHRRVEELIRTAGIPPADAILHDLSRPELRAIWHHDKLVMVIDDFPSAVPPSEG